MGGGAPRLQPHLSTGSTGLSPDARSRGKGLSRMLKAQAESGGSSAASQPQARPDAVRVSLPRSRAPGDLEDGSACRPVGCSLHRGSFWSRGEPRSLSGCLGVFVSAPLLYDCLCVYVFVCLPFSEFLALSLSVILCVWCVCVCVCVCVRL